MRFLVSLYFGNNEEDISFIYSGVSIEAVVQELLNTHGKQAIDLEGGYRIVNFDRVNYIDVVGEANQ